MEPEDTLRCIDAIMPLVLKPSNRTASQVAILERSLAMICSHHGSTAGSILAPRLTSLLTLAQSMRGSQALTQAVLVVLEQVLPYGHDARLPGDDLSLSGISARADQRWQTRKLSLPETTGDFFDSLLQEEALSTEATAIAVTLVRSSLPARSRFAKWLQNTEPKRSLLRILPAFDAFLDMVSISGSQPESEGVAILQAVGTHMPELLNALFNAQVTTMQRQHSASCISTLVRVLPGQESRLRQACCDAITAAPHSAMLNREVVSLFNELGTDCPVWRESEGPVALAVESGLKWLVRRFAEDPKDSEELLLSLTQFGELHVIGPDA